MGSSDAAAWAKEVTLVTCCIEAMSPDDCADRKIQVCNDRGSAVCVLWFEPELLTMCSSASLRPGSPGLASLTTLYSGHSTNSVPSAQKADWKMGVGKWGRGTPRHCPAGECRFPGTGERQLIHVQPWGVRMAVHCLSPRDPNNQAPPR